MDPRAIALVAILLLPAPSLMLAAGHALAGEGHPAATPTATGVPAVDLTVAQVQKPPALDAYNYSDVMVLINNGSSLSRRIGEYFAQARDIPPDQVAYLDVPDREVITKAQFDDLKDQVKDFMRDNGLVSKVNYIVTTKGFPLRTTNQSFSYIACVDEELALLFGSYESSIGGSGPVNSPYYGRREYFDKSHHGVYLVNRLTGYDWNDVKGIIDRANRTYGNRGKFVLDVDPQREVQGYWIGNQWLRNARDILQERGEEVVFNDTTWFVTHQEDVMGYASWGSNDHHDTDHAKPHNTWVNGSIAETYVSFGGRTFTHPPRYGQSMIADLIREGVTGVKGYVYEPYLSAVAHPDVLFERYTAGFNLAESYRMASTWLGWMGVVVGDPKSSPYRDVPDLYVHKTLLSVTNSTPATGDPIVLQARVRNHGGRVEDANVSLYMDGELVDHWDLTFDTFSLTTINLSTEAPSTMGPHTYRVVLNGGPEPFFETRLGEDNEAELEIEARERPVVSLSVSDTDVMTMESVRFNLLVEHAPRPITRYYFDFGDGTARHVLQSNTTVHSFGDDGEFLVTAWVVDEGMVLSVGSRVGVTVGNRAPTAIISVDPPGALAGDELAFSASDSYDLDGQVVEVSWDLGDGNGSTDGTVTHAYRRPGEYIVGLTVTDDDGATATTTRIVNAINNPPEARFVLEGAEIRKGRTVTFDASASFDTDGRVVQYDWTFGDGTEGKVTSSPWVDHVFGAAGEVTVTLAVFDDMGGVDGTSRVYRVINARPTVGLEVDPLEVLTGEAVYLDGSGSSDPDGRVVWWEFSVVDPGGGVTQLASGPSETTTFRPPDDGTWTVVLAVTDDDGGVTEGEASLEVVNRPPAVSLLEDTLAMVGSVQVAPANLSLGVEASDRDGKVASIRWVLGEGGELMANGSVVWLIFEEEEEVSLRVVVADDDGASARTWLNLTVNLPPTAGLEARTEERVLDLTDATVLKGEVLAFDGGSSSDPGGVARYQWDMGDGHDLEGRAVEHAYATAGTFTVTLKVTDYHGATDRRVVTIQVDEPPEGDGPVVSGTALAIIVAVMVAALALAVLLVHLRSRGEG